jgi:hypothetical protein
MLAVVLAVAVDANAIVAEMIARTNAATQVRQERELAFVKKGTVEDLNREPPRIEKTQEWRLWWNAAGGHQQLIVANGKPISHAKIEPPGPDIVTMLSAKFNVRMDDPPEARCGDRRCWVILFEPSNPDDPAETDEMAVINHLTGRAWIDTEQLYPVRVEAKLASTFRRKLVGKIQEVKVVLTYDLYENIPVLITSTTDLAYTRWIFGNVRERATYQYESFHFEKTSPRP